jgi:hypothetical protein
MRIKYSLLATTLALGLIATSANGQNLLTNGNLDQVQPVEIVAGFFLPKPLDWVNVGTRTISGPFEDEMSSEPWAGPAPTPVTTDGSGLASPDGCGGTDCAVFFKPFSGNPTDGAASGDLYQDQPATPGLTYTLTGWAGAEPNFLGGAEFALDFLDTNGGLLSSAEVDLVAAGLFVDNGEAFDYKQFTVSGVAPVGATTVRSRASLIEGMSNPAGGGQAYVVDDFVLTAVPEPSSLGLGIMGLISVLLWRRR